MASRPIYNSQIQSLRNRGADGELEVLEWFATGKLTVHKIVKALDVGTRPFYDWLKEDPERWGKWQEAKRLRAEMLAEDAIDIIDSAPESKEAVMKATAQAKVRQWLAACSDPERFGKRAEVNVSIGAVHLTAVEEINAADTKRRLAAAKAKEIAAPVEDADFEIVPANDVESLLG